MTVEFFFLMFAICMGFLAVAIAIDRVSDATDRVADAIRETKR